MYRFRLLIVLFITGFVLALNIERPDTILNLGQINVSPNVYVISAITVGIVLLIPNLSTANMTIQVMLLLAVYWATKLIIDTRDQGEIASDFVTYVEMALLILLFWGARKLSEAIIRFREEIDRVVLGSAKQGFQTFVYDEGNLDGAASNPDVLSNLYDEQLIREEMLRARRYSSSFALFMVRVEGLPKPRFAISAQWGGRVELENLYIRTYIIQLLQDLLLDEGDIAIWRQDNLLVGLPKTDGAAAEEFVKNLRQAFEVLTDFSPRIGFAVFPDDALVYADLVEVAAARVMTDTAEEPIDT